MKKTMPVLLILALALVSGMPVLATQLGGQVISSGGTAQSSSAGLELASTLGQPASGRSSSPNLRLITGFWQDFEGGGSGSCCTGRVGDANMSGDDEPTIGDISAMIDAKFVTGACDGILNCLLEADINQSGGAGPTCDDITIGDISGLIDYLFITGPSLGLPGCL